MQRNQDRVISSIFVACSVIIPGFILCCLALFTSNRFQASASFSWILGLTGLLFPVFLVVGACFGARGAGHSPFLPFKPWRWATVTSQSGVREIARDGAAVGSVEPSVRSNAPSADIPLQYARPVALNSSPNSPLPIRAFAHLLEDPFGLLALVLFCGAFGVIAAMRRTPASPPTAHLWAVIVAFCVSGLSLVIAIIRTYRRFQYAVTLSALVLRIAPASRRGFSDLAVEYTIDNALIAGRVQVPSADAIHLNPGDTLDVIIVQQRVDRPIYDLRLAPQLNRFGSPHSDTANQRLRNNPIIRQQRGRSAVFAGIGFVALGIWVGSLLRELDHEGGQRVVWIPIAILYDLLGTGGTIACFLIFGCSLLVWGSFTILRKT